MRKQGQQQVIYKPTDLYVYIIYIYTEDIICSHTVAHIRTFFNLLQIKISAVHPSKSQFLLALLHLYYPPTLQLKMMM